MPIKINIRDKEIEEKEESEDSEESEEAEENNKETEEQEENLRLEDMIDTPRRNRKSQASVSPNLEISNDTQLETQITTAPTQRTQENQNTNSPQYSSNNPSYQTGGQQGDYQPGSYEAAEPGTPRYPKMITARPLEPINPFLEISSSQQQAPRILRPFETAQRPAQDTGEYPKLAEPQKYESMDDQRRKRMKKF